MLEKQISVSDNMNDINNTSQKLFFGSNTFHEKLETECIWDIEKYWKLEIILIDIIKNTHNNKTIAKNLAGNLYYLSSYISKSVQSTLCENDHWNIENLSIDDILYYHDRFNILINILWKNHNYQEYNYFFRENPIYATSNPP